METIKVVEPTKSKDENGIAWKLSAVPDIVEIHLKKLLSTGAYLPIVGSEYFGVRPAVMVPAIAENGEAVAMSSFLSTKVFALATNGLGVYTRFTGPGWSRASQWNSPFIDHLVKHRPAVAFIPCLESRADKIISAKMGIGAVYICDTRERIKTLLEAYNSAIYLLLTTTEPVAAATAAEPVTAEPASSSGMIVPTLNPIYRKMIEPFLTVVAEITRETISEHVYTSDITLLNELARLGAEPLIGMPRAVSRFADEYRARYMREMNRLAVKNANSAAEYTNALIIGAIRAIHGAVSLRGPVLASFSRREKEVILAEAEAMRARFRARVDCEHVKILLRLMPDAGTFRCEEYTRLKSMLAKPKNNWISCTNCHSRVICLHKQMIIESVCQSPDGKSRQALSTRLARFAHGAAGMPVCSNCGEDMRLWYIEIPEVPYDAMHKDLRGMILVESTILTRGLSFSKPIDPQKYIYHLADVASRLVRREVNIGDQNADVSIIAAVYAAVIHDMSNSTALGYQVAFVNIPLERGKKQKMMLKAIIDAASSRHGFHKRGVYDDFVEQIKEYLKRITAGVEKLDKKGLLLRTYENMMFHDPLIAHLTWTKFCLGHPLDFDAAFKLAFGRSVPEYLAAVDSSKRAEMYFGAEKLMMPVKGNEREMYLASCFNTFVRSVSSSAEHTLEEMRHIARIESGYAKIPPLGELPIAPVAPDIEPATITAVYDENGDEHQWNQILIYTDGKSEREFKENEARPREFKYLESRCAKCGVRRSETGRLSVSVTMKALSDKNQFDNVFVIFNVRCPGGGVHEYSRGDRCSKCGFFVAISGAAKRAYFDKYLSKYLEIIAPPKAALREIGAAAPNRFLSWAKQWKFDAAVIESAAAKFEVDPALLSTLGRYESRARKREDARKIEDIHSQAISNVREYYLRVISGYNYIKSIWRMGTVAEKYRKYASMKFTHEYSDDFNEKYDAFIELGDPQRAYNYTLSALCLLLIDLTERGYIEYAKDMIVGIMRTEHLLTMPSAMNFKLETESPTGADIGVGNTYSVRDAADTEINLFSYENIDFDAGTNVEPNDM